MEQQKTWLGLLRRRQCLVPTWRGWLALALCFAGLAIFCAQEMYPFLAVNAPIPGGVLVVEGWAPDAAMEAAIAEFHRNHYEKLFVTGIPIERGAPLVEYKTYAELGAATLLRLGMSSNVVQAVPAPRVLQDRTYAMAASLSRWLREHGMSPTKVNVITAGAHARRSRMLFQRALGKEVTVGVIPMEETEFDYRHWWRSSQGFRVVTGEALAYVYARVFFRAPKE
jgi:hypothetical protein